MKVTILTTLVAAAPLAFAVPHEPIERRQACPLPSNNACLELVNRCVAQPAGWMQNPWSIRVCVAAATCYGVGNLFTSARCTLNTAVPNPATLPSMSAAVTANFVGSCTTCPITQQNYIDFVYGTIQSSWPSSVSIVIGWWTAIAQWTAFPSGNVPINNFNDWLKYSSAPTNPTNPPTSSSTTNPPTSSSVRPSSSTPTTTPTPPANCPPPANASCRDLVNGCVFGSTDWPTNPWSKKACVAAATCYGVGNLFAYGRCALNRNMPVVSSVPALSTTVYNGIVSCSGCPITAQNFVDLIYSSITTGAWPESGTWVINNWWVPIANWAGFPNQQIPYNNFNDWLHWSSTEPGSPPTGTTTPPTSTSTGGPPTQTGTHLNGLQTRCHHDASISFDDGPYIYSDQFLTTFRNAGNSKTTFFLNGNNYGCIYSEDNVARIRRMYEAGHTIASHTWSHADLQTLSQAQLASEIDRLETALWKILGIKPGLIRPPYGSINNNIVNYLNGRGYTVVTWDIDSQDSLGASVATSMNIIRSQAGSGSMILCHEPVASTAQSLASQAVSYVRGLGLNLVTVDQCLDVSPYQAVGSYGTRDSTWVC